MTLAEVTTPDCGGKGTSDAMSSKPKPRRKRKSTGTRRREEIGVLQAELKALEAQVAQLHQQAETVGDAKRAGLEHDMLETGFIRQAVLQQQASLVNVQSALSRLTMAQSGAPHVTSIRLGRNLEERWATLTEMKPIKLRAAQFYLKERGRFVDDTSAFSYSVRFEEQDGCFCDHIYDVVPFEGVSCVKTVYDALYQYFSNMEICVTESLGDITIREDDDISKPGISQCRFVSYLSNGPLLEMNSIICFEFKEVDAEYGDGGAVGIFTEDFVDQDELYPYFPEERVRQDVTVVTQVRAHMKKIKNSEGVEEERPIVVMQRWAHCRIHKPNMALSPDILHEIREKSSHWGDVKVDAVRELVYRSSSPTTSE